MRDVVAAGDIAHRLALFAPPDRLALLVRVEFRFTTHLHTTRHSSVSAFAGADADTGWTAAEFNMVFTREILEGKLLVVLVWSDVKKTDVFEYCPTLANVVAAHWKPDDQDNSIGDVARGIEAE